MKQKAARKDAAFRWTDEEWAVLEPMSLEERFKFVLSRVLTVKPDICGPDTKLTVLNDDPSSR